MLSPSGTDAKAGALYQVQACQRQVSELRASLSLLSERCGCLEDVHKGAIEKLRALGSSNGQATLEQLKKQSTAKVRGLQNRHGELMRLLQDELSRHSAENFEKSEDNTGPRPKAAAPALKATAASLQAKPEAPLTLGSEENTDASVTVLPMDGRAARLSSRLRCLAYLAFSSAAESAVSSLAGYVL